MGIQIKRIGHIGILVADFERSFKFYTEVFGLREIAKLGGDISPLVHPQVAEALRKHYTT